MSGFPPLSAKQPVLWHGGDYNPEQWSPDTWEEDDRLMEKAHWNSVTVGVFSWVSLEPEESTYTFEWLDEIMDRQARAGRIVGLATPSAAPPAWLSQSYPETLRVGADGARRKHGNRVNYCWTSPIYREKTRWMAHVLAERYGDHPALAYWHISNEFGGECHCQLCQEAFRQWLKRRYGSLDKINQAYWTAFWSHTYTDWSQIESPGAPLGEESIIGLTLDWRRFTTDQIVDFYLNEAACVREAAPGIPVTTNLMGFYPGLNPWKIAPHVDFAAWDSYPFFRGKPNDIEPWLHTAMTHDMMRSLKGKPFLLMECTPSSSNWYPVMRLKRPNAHRLEGLQAIAHGADGVQYFQWRQGRGSGEQFHGAIVAHDGRDDTRVSQEVAALGEALLEMPDVVGTHADSKVAIIYDWEVGWAIEAVAGPRIEGREYRETVLSHYRAFWEQSVPVDVISSECDYTSYKLLVAPMLFMLKPGVAKRLADFVHNGGTLATTYWSAVVDESGLAFAGGYPSPLREALGIRSEEIDAIYDDERNEVVGFTESTFEARQLCELIHAETAEVMATYGRDFYAGRPALTVNRYGEGKAYYVASRNDSDFQRTFFGLLIQELKIDPAVGVRLPAGVTARWRGNRLFLLNCTPEPLTVEGLASLESFGSAVLSG